MTRPRIGLALGSGGARGWSHIGIIGSLIEAGIEPKEGAVAKGTLGSTHVVCRRDGRFIR